MADFSAVLKKTIDKLRENTPEAREKVYQKARATIEAKLVAITPPPPANVATRQRKLLEDAIASVEAEYATAAPEPIAEDLDSIFAELHPAALEPEPEPEPAVSAPEEPEPTAAPERPNADLRPSAPAPQSDDETPAEAVNTDAEDEERRGETPQEPEPANWDAGEPPLPGTPRRRRGGGFVAVLLILVLAGAGYAGWFYREDLARLVNLEDAQTPTGDEASQTAEDGTEPESSEETASDEASEPPATPTRKFTQRLTPDGGEVDEGPAGGEPGLGEGTSVAQSNASGEEDAEGPAPAAENDDGAPATAGNGASEQATAAGQRAIFYEERTNVSQGSADAGTVAWSLVQESPGNDLPQEPAIRAEATIPQKNLQLKMTIRRNADQSLPASHVIEIIFLTPDNFEGGGIDNVLRIALKRSEQDAGNPLLGIPAKIADGFFLVALSDSSADAQTNMLLLRRQEWIDIPVVYKSGRRALITIEKGDPGEDVFNEALTAWQNATNG